MGHIGPLPLSSGFDAILVIVDRFTKLAHFVPASTTDNSRDLARHFLANVFRLHGLPDDIVSDRGATFASAWWTEFCFLLGSKVRLSTAFHPQTDGQTERTNQSVEHYLRCFTNYLQSDWADLLHSAEFVYNNARHSSTSQSPFFTSYGFNPSSLLDFSVDPHLRPSSSIPNVQELASSIATAHGTARSALAHAADRMSKSANAHRSPTPSFQVGDLVYLLRSDHIHTTRPSEKLDDKNIGPFPVTHVLGSHKNRLNLGYRRLHNVFHVDRLTLYVSPDTYEYSGRPRLTRPPPDTVDPEAYEVSESISTLGNSGNIYSTSFAGKVMAMKTCNGSPPPNFTSMTNWYFDLRLQTSTSLSLMVHALLFVVPCPTPMPPTNLMTP